MFDTSPHTNAATTPFTWDFNSGAAASGIVSENDQSVFIASENDPTITIASENQ